MFGVKGRSILSLVSKCDLVTSNYMHAVLLGVLQQFIFSWCDSASNCRPYYLGRQMSTLDAALLQIKPPSTIKTVSLSLSLTSHTYWKNFKWRSFLLLKSLLPREYFHYCYVLVFSIYNSMITAIHLDCLCTAEQALHKLVSLVAELYYVQHVGLNVHLLSHLVASVTRWHSHTGAHQHYS